MKKAEKSSLISKVQDNLQGASGVFVVENRGLTVKKTEELRRILAPITVMFKVVKNRLLKRALDGSKFAPISDLLKNPTAVALATDPFAVAKALHAFAEANPNLAIVGGQMDDGLMSADDVVTVAKLPSMDEIRGTFLRLLSEPAARMARVTSKYAETKQ